MRKKYNWRTQSGNLRLFGFLHYLGIQGRKAITAKKCSRLFGSSLTPRRKKMLK